MGALLATVAALAVAGSDVASRRGDAGVAADGEVALPTDVATPATPADDPHRVRCTREGVVFDCLAWDVDTDGPVSLGPRLPDDRVLVDGARDGITVRDAATGAVQWRREDLGGARPLQLADDVLVVRTGRGAVSALDLDDGTERWRGDRLHSLGALPELRPDLVVLGRAVEEQVDGLVGLDPGTGEVVWTWTTPWGGPISSSAQAVGPDAVVVTGAGRLARVDVTTGTTVWEVATLEGGYLQAHPPDHVSVQQLTEGDDPRLRVHTAATGDVLLELPATRIASHLVAGDHLVAHAPAEGVVRAHDLATGEVAWRLLLEGGPGALGFRATGLAPEQEALVVLERTRQRATRLDPATGVPLWRAALQPSTPPPERGGTFLGTPAIVDDHVVVEDTSSVITVLDLATGQERVRVAGAPELDVRSLRPLTLVQGSRWLRVEVPAPTEGQ